MLQVAVLGAGGGAGRAIAAELVVRGHRVTAVTRDGRTIPGVAAEPVAADLSDPDAAVAACRDADVVVMAAQVPYRRWGTELPRLVEHAIAGAAAADARLVMVDNLYAYGAPDGVITEETPEAATTRKGVLRRALGERLLAAHRDGTAPVALARFSDYYGPGGTNAMVYVLGVSRALAGRAPRAMIDADVAHTFAYLPDVARGIGRIVESPDADGEVWILPAAPALTQRELLTLVAHETGLAPRIGRVGPALLRVGGLFSPDLRELWELIEQWDRPYVSDATKLVTRLGALETTPHERAVAETVASFRDASPVA